MKWQFKPIGLKTHKTQVFRQGDVCAVKISKSYNGVGWVLARVTRAIYHAAYGDWLFDISDAKDGFPLGGQWQRFCSIPPGDGPTIEQEGSDCPQEAARTLLAAKTERCPGLSAEQMSRLFGND
jgi:hypothetical protein